MRVYTANNNTVFSLTKNEALKEVPPLADFASSNYKLSFKRITIENGVLSIIT